MQDSNYLNELFEERWMYLSHARTEEDCSFPAMTDRINNQINNVTVSVQEDISQDLSVTNENSLLKVFSEEEDNVGQIDHDTPFFDNDLFLSENFVNDL
jgi:hypothetical protein